MRRIATIATIAVVAVAGVAGLAAWAVSDGQESRLGQLIPYEDAQAVALGETIYADHCAACHGADLEGQVPDWRSRDAAGLLPAPPHDETGHTWHHADALLIDITKRGTEAVVGRGYRSNMMGFADVLTESEILAALAFIKSTWPDEVIEIHNRINADSVTFSN
ncbi:cytochrome c [Rhodovulum sp. 12E13]|uniref:c-type cytochrome n=1 Tax=Rhodovulum sp. 12E13 TaxID=2203891 RepID=UPI000E134B27|nr:cytochrome c [Rhodovulum sp. 12E13]RDC72851.1 cytochrome c [Rhodovulum sp. 12E13]